MRYKNSFHNPYDPKYGTEFYESDGSEPVPYLGLLIYRRFRGCFDIVQDGVCVGSCAGINGAKQAIEERRCSEIMQGQGDPSAGETTMTAADIQIGKTFYFGHRSTPNTVTRVIPLENSNQYIARVYLKGPRGGEFVACVREDGTCRKM